MSFNFIRWIIKQKHIIVANDLNYVMFSSLAVNGALSVQVI